MTSSIRIYDLLDFPQHVPASSRWMWEEWDNCAAGRWGKASKKPKVSAGAMLFYLLLFRTIENLRHKCVGHSTAAEIGMHIHAP